MTIDFFGSNSSMKCIKAEQLVQTTTDFGTEHFRLKPRKKQQNLIKKQSKRKRLDLDAKRGLTKFRIKLQNVLS